MSADPNCNTLTQSVLVPLTIIRLIALWWPSLIGKSEYHLFAALVSVIVTSLRISTARASPGSMICDWSVCARPSRSSASTR